VKLQSPNVRYSGPGNEVLVVPGSFPPDEIVILYQPA